MNITLACFKKSSNFALDFVKSICQKDKQNGF